MCKMLLLNFPKIWDITREDPPSRLAKMGAMPTPFRGGDRDVEDKAPLHAEREEPRSETPPGKHDSAQNIQDKKNKINISQIRQLNWILWL